MGAPVSKLEAAEEQTAEALLSAFKHMEGTERRKHATVYNYWLSIRRNGELPPIRDLDPLEISDASPCGVLLELIEAGQDAEILHVGERLRDGIQVKRVSEAPDPSVLKSVASKLGIVAISREALAFEDRFEGNYGTTRCCVTLLPFSMTGEAVDFVYALASVELGVRDEEETVEVDAAEQSAEETPPVVETAQEEPEPATSEPEVLETEPFIDEAPQQADEAPQQADEAPQQADETPEQTAEIEAQPEAIEEEPLPEFLQRGPEAPEPAASKPGFSSKVFDALAGAKGFFGTTASTDPEPEAEAVAEETSPEPVAEEPAPAADEPEAVAEEPADIEDRITEDEAAAIEEPELAEETAPMADESELPAKVDPFADEPAPITEEAIETPQYAVEGSLQSKLTQVRSIADESKAARLKSEALMLEGLSAAYDFALDAEDAPEEYLKLVEEKGLKIQLRSPMKPVVKLAFDGYCDDATIKQLESVLSWALKMDLPRGSLSARIEEEGGIEAVLNGQKRRAGDAN